MDTKNKKGYVILLLLMIVGVILASSMSIQTGATFFHRENLQEMNEIKAYYAVVAGLRYASILLEDTSVLTFGPGNIYNVTFTELGGSLTNDLDPGNLSLAVIIYKETNPGSPYYRRYWANATCTY